MTDRELQQLRRDFVLTADRECWSDAERDEIGAQIAAAVSAGDDEALQGWARQLGWWRELLESYAPRLRAFEARVKAEARRRRERERAAA